MAFLSEPIRAAHSFRRTPAGTVVHTGDFKLDSGPVDDEQPDYAKFAAPGKHGILCSCSDATNVGRPGRTGSETELGEALQGRFAEAPGRILVATLVQVAVLVILRALGGQLQGEAGVGELVEPHPWRH